MDGNESAEDMHFFYDAQSRTALVEYNGVKYRYIHNLQGDIVGIVDSNGDLVVEYKYDAWGKPISTTMSMADTLGEHNPLRYRGYVYDAEDDLYYLYNRYYSPEVLRFIQMDRMIVHKRMRNIITNVFSYSYNTPVVSCDKTGEDAILITDASSLTHSSLLIQDENYEWHYFYWGASKEGPSENATSNMASNSSSFSGSGNVCVIYEKIDINIQDISEDSILNEVNEILAEDMKTSNPKYKYTDTYDEALYLKGDFTTSHAEANRLKENANKLTYSLLLRNCAQAALGILMSSYRKRGDYYNIGVLDRAMWEILPSFVHKKVAKELRR